MTPLRPTAIPSTRFLHPKNKIGENDVIIVIAAPDPKVMLLLKSDPMNFNDIWQEIVFRDLKPENVLVRDCVNFVKR